MRATLDRDIIVCFTEKGETEVGPRPEALRGVGLERLRFDGKKIVDLMGLTEIWVEPLPGGAFTLHAVPVPGAELVKMSYLDRRNLVRDPGGKIRIKTASELTAEKLELESQLLKNRIRDTLAGAVGDRDDQLADLYKIVAVLIDYLLTHDLAAAAILTAILPGLKAAYPAARTAETIPERISALSAELGQYYEAKDALTKAAETKSA